MIVHDVVQRSPEWHALRLGHLTSSCAADMLATVQKGEAADRRNLRARLVLERLTGKPQERGYSSRAMQQGIERESDATALYEALTGRVLRDVGFVTHDSLMAGYSPDGVVGDFEGLVEAKCPIPATHLDYLERGKVPGAYLSQIVHALWITGAPWCDWFSFQADFPEPLQVRLVRIARDETAIKAYEQKALAFLAEVDAKVESLRTMASTRQALLDSLAVAS